MCEKPRVTVKLSEVQLSFACDLPYIATFLGSRKIYVARDITRQSTETKLFAFILNIKPHYTNNSSSPCRAVTFILVFCT